ncbi:LTA synthase family protein [Pseudomonas fontis]|uniref:LTA synthase family protein n=1 Tax=Pseudomonas fontis TaxID=2942633 RepID=A0ABT5NYT3_9PSED|nr:LTA synthase family protein [Pseudomonas fontis]MDD0973984.1 LTA synthase family protein [Pseudomonas fontis]MDD0993350.1 LTA synthase family protein [Pseudomonas fontis]
MNLVTLNFLTLSIREASVTALLLASLFVLLDTVVRRRYFSMLPLALPLIVIAIISQQKLGYLSEPLYPWDFIFAEQIYKLLPELANEKPQQLMVVLGCGLLLTALTLWLIRLVFRKQRGTAPGRPMLASSVLTVLALVVCINTAFGQRFVQDVLKIQAMPWVQVENYRQNGFILAFAMNMESALIERPDLSVDTVLEQVAKLPAVPAAASDEQRPDIIFVMSEAFWDPTRLPGVHLSPDPMPTIRALSSGDIFSPSQGGNTSNVEFELLTGFSNAFLPVGSVPYQQYVHRNLPSIIWTLKAQGYATMAMHPYYKHFWNRDNVYRYLGFDHFMALEDMPGIAARGPFAGDGALLDRLYETLEATTQPTVLFAITMQNHGPYEKDRYAQPMVSMQLDGQLDEHDAVQIYSQGVHDADDALKLLIERLSKRSRPSLLVFFGDHTPYLGKNLSAYRQSGLVSNSASDELSQSDYVNLHQTPLVIWSSTPAQSGAQVEKLLSPSMLPSVIMNKLHIQHPFYSGVLQDVARAFPVVDRRVLRKEDGQWIEHWRGQEDPSIQRYHAIQYDMIFGKQESHSALFSDMPIQ